MWRISYDTWMVAYDGCIFLSVIKKLITGRVYVEHLKKNFATLKERYTQYIFQQDNAPAHTCKLVNEFFVKEGITSLKWPAKSPDLNIMDNIWHMLSEKVYSGRRFNNVYFRLKGILNLTQERNNQGIIRQL